MKTWLKGGLWGLGIGIVLLLLPRLLSYIAGTNPNIGGYVATIISFPFLILFVIICGWEHREGILICNTYFHLSLVWFVFIIIFFILGVLIGSLIGLIIQKIKSRNKIER